MTGYSLTWSTGNIDIETPAIRALDATTARSNGHFNKLGFSAMRLQSVTDTVSLYAGINGQIAVGLGLVFCLILGFKMRERFE